MKVLIVGVGLIGGSFALVLRKHGIAEQIIGVEQTPRNAEKALQLGLVDKIVSLEEGIAEADLIVLAVPVPTALSASSARSRRSFSGTSP